MDKPTKPTDLVPRSFGGVKNNFSSSLQSSGYEDGVPAIYGGDNLNYQLDCTGKELDYCEKICDYINAMPIGKTITVDANNKLIYEENKTIRHVGEIVTSTLPLTDAGLHLLDGTLIQGSGSYSAFVTYIAGLVTDYPDLFATEADWQTAVTTYGVCGKFVYDNVNNTVRLPKITGFIEGTTDVTALGDLVQAGLPNITGSLYPSSTATDVQAWGEGVNTFTGAFSTSTTYTHTTVSDGGASNTSLRRINFNASNSNSIYGNSTTVQPQAIKVLYYIVIATFSKTDIEVDIDEIATDLNNKADIDGSNMASSVKNFDGDIVVVPSASRELASGVSMTTSNKTYDISSILPNDNYNYEVWLTGSVTTGSTSGNRTYLEVSSGIFPALTICRARTVAANFVYSGGSCVLPVGQARTITVSGNTNANGTYDLDIMGYRRIGTNS